MSSLTVGTGFVAQSRARMMTPADPFDSVIVHTVGQLLVVTDRNYKLVAVGINGNCDTVLVAICGKNEYRDAQRKHDAAKVARRRVLRGGTDGRCREARA